MNKNYPKCFYTCSLQCVQKNIYVPFQQSIQNLSYCILFQVVLFIAELSTQLIKTDCCWIAFPWMLALNTLVRSVVSQPFSFFNGILGGEVCRCNITTFKWLSLKTSKLSASFRIQSKQRSTIFTQHPQIEHFHIGILQVPLRKKKEYF